MTIRQLRNYIDGRFEDGASTFDKHSPVDHALIAQVHEASREQVDRAVAAARRALPAWAALPVAARTDQLLALADGITRRFDDFLQAESATPASRCPGPARSTSRAGPRISAPSPSWRARWTWKAT